MTKSLRTALVAGAALALLLGPFVPASRAAGAGGQTLQNLQTAYDGESNAHARYLAFAKQADAEGFAGAASLFRAAAHAEQIHAAAHADVIRKLGGQPQAEIKAPEVKSTRENLAAAIEGESYERDTMYPGFIAQARTEGNRDALRSFNYAKTAEAEHAKLYAEARASLDGWKTARDFYVCAVCGLTTTNLNFEKCASCFNSKDRYVKVS